MTNTLIILEDRIFCRIRHVNIYIYIYIYIYVGVIPAYKCTYKCRLTCMEELFTYRWITQVIISK